MKKVIVIGGGAAGMMAAIAAADAGAKVTIYEHNEKLGKKLFITGKGRCNVTNAGDMENLFANVMTNEKFLYSAFYTYDNQAVRDFVEKATDLCLQLLTQTPIYLLECRPEESAAILVEEGLCL